MHGGAWTLKWSKLIEVVDPDCLEQIAERFASFGEPGFRPNAGVPLCDPIMDPEELS